MSTVNDDDFDFDGDIEPKAQTVAAPVATPPAKAPAKAKSPEQPRESLAPVVTPPVPAVASEQPKVAVQKNAALHDKVPYAIRVKGDFNTMLNGVAVKFKNGHLFKPHTFTFSKLKTLENRGFMYSKE